jgi:hypothetical protein
VILGSLGGSRMTLQRRLTDGLIVCRSDSKPGSRGATPESSAERAKGSGGQATKSIRWMPWHQEAMKDVVKLR